LLVCSCYRFCDGGRFTTSGIGRWIQRDVSKRERTDAARRGRPAIGRQHVPTDSHAASDTIGPFSANALSAKAFGTFSTDAEHETKSTEADDSSQFPEPIDAAASVRETCNSQAGRRDEAIHAFDTTIDPQHETDAADDETFFSFDQTDQPDNKTVGPEHASFATDSQQTDSG
jgi:hypothetical protein